VGQWAGIDNVMTQARITTVLHIPVLASDIAMSKLGETAPGKILILTSAAFSTQKEVKNNGGLIQCGT
jgi:filamentous hemagglutinin